MAELRNENLELESFAQIVKKAGVAEAKANLRSWAATENMDQQYSQSSWSAQTPAVKAKDQLSKDSQKEKPKVRNPKSTLHFSNPEPSAKGWEDKKDHWRQEQ